MAQRMFGESGRDGRSVLGMLEVQIERDPKTGTTVVRSVAPVSTPAGASEAVAVFDDGRKTIHTVGGSGSQPSNEELGQILSVVDRVGMKALLDEAPVTTNTTQMETENSGARSTTQEKSLLPHQDDTQSDSSRSFEQGTRSCAVSVAKEEERRMVVVRDAAEVGNVQHPRPEEGPVTLVFLGYTDARGGHSHEDHEGAITVERVVITEEGEECVLGAETLEQVIDRDVEKVDGNGAGVQSKDSDLQKSPAASAAEEGGTSKRKRCQCCSVM